LLCQSEKKDNHAKKEKECRIIKWWSKRLKKSFCSKQRNKAVNNRQTRPCSKLHFRIAPQISWIIKNKRNQEFKPFFHFAI
jgi:hypothetical protein